MTPIQILLIGIVLLLFLVVLYFLLQKRELILYNMEQTEKNILEGMDKNDPEYTNCYNSVNSVALDSIQNPHGITGNVNDHFRNLPLKQLCIKGSANSAYTGSYITDIMVNYVLSRGCRFLDFEVYYLPDVNGTYNACVGYSEDPLEVKPSIYNKSHVLLIDMLQNSLVHAFSGGSNSYKVVNTGDPVFFNLRMKTDEDNVENLYKLIQKILKSTRENPQYSKYFTDKQVTGKTTIRELMGKAVIAIENHYLIPVSPNKKLYNMVSNSDNLNKSHYIQVDTHLYKGCPPKSHDNNHVLFECKHGFNMVAPDFNVTYQHNANVYSSIYNYGNQITLMQYYVMDQELIEHEKMFKTYNGSFVPMALCLKYIHNYAVPEDLQKHAFPTLF